MVSMVSLPEPCMGMHGKKDTDALIAQSGVNLEGQIDISIAKFLEDVRTGIAGKNLAQNPVIEGFDDGSRQVVGCDRAVLKGRCHTILPTIKKGVNRECPSIEGWKADTSCRCRYLMSGIEAEEVR